MENVGLAADLCAHLRSCLGEILTKREQILA